MGNKCVEFWSKGFFKIYDSSGEDKTQERETTRRREVNDTIRVDHTKTEDFLKASKECASEAASQVSIPTASGIAVGATTLGVGGGIAGVYLIPKLIKLFVG